MYTISASNSAGLQQNQGNAAESVVFNRTTSSNSLEEKESALLNKVEGYVLYVAHTFQELRQTYMADHDALNCFLFSGHGEFANFTKCICQSKVQGNGRQREAHVTIVGQTFYIVEGTDGAVEIQNQRRECLSTAQIEYEALHSCALIAWLQHFNNLSLSDTEQTIDLSDFCFVGLGSAHDYNPVFEHACNLNSAHFIRCNLTGVKFNASLKHVQFDNCSGTPTTLTTEARQDIVAKYQARLSADPQQMMPILSEIDSSDYTPDDRILVMRHVLEYAIQHQKQLHAISQVLQGGFLNTVIKPLYNDQDSPDTMTTRAIVDSMVFKVSTKDPFMYDIEYHKDENKNIKHTFKLLPHQNQKQFDSSLYEMRKLQAHAKQHNKGKKWLEGELIKIFERDCKKNLANPVPLHRQKVQVLLEMIHLATNYGIKWDDLATILATNSRAAACSDSSSVPD